MEDILSQRLTLEQQTKQVRKQHHPGQGCATPVVTSGRAAPLRLHQACSCLHDALLLTVSAVWANVSTPTLPPGVWVSNLCRA